MSSYKGPFGYSNFYEDFGGKSLGKKLSSDKLGNIDFLKIPEYFILKIDNILNKDLKKLYGKDLVIKLSKKGDDFSDTSLRGQNSSSFLPKIKNFTGEKSLKEILGNIDLTDVSSIILEEIVKLDNNFSYIITYDGNFMKIEISENDKNLWFYKIDNHGRIINFESNNFENKLPGEFGEKIFKNILNIHKKNLFKILNRFYKYRVINYIMIQVRPIPNEKIDKNIKFKIEEDFEGEIFNTNFVYGIFDKIGIVEKVNLENYSLKEEKIFILDKNTRYFDELILFRLKNNLSTILIDTYDGFSLSHDKKYLPNVNLRENFKYISCIGKDLLGKKVNIISDGEKGQVLLFNNNL